MNKIKCYVCGEKANWFFIHDGQYYCDECKDDIINDFEPIEKKEKETKYGFNKFIKKQRRRIDEASYLDTIRKQTAKEIFKEIDNLLIGIYEITNISQVEYILILNKLNKIKKKFLGGKNE